MALMYGTIVCLFLMLFLTSGCGEKTAGTEENKYFSGPVVQDKFVLAGSGSNLPVTGKLVERYSAKTGMKIELPSSIGSDGAINAVKSEKLELGLISRHLTPAERELGLREVPYARVAVVFGAHKNVLDTGVSTSDVIDIFKGSKMNWSDGSKIYVFVREKNDSSNLILYDQIPGFKDALFESYQDRRWEILYRDSDMAYALNRTNSTFGVVNSTDIATNDSIKALDFNGISPTPHNVLNGEYKLVKDLSFVYENQINSRGMEFLNFVFSPEGQKIIMDCGAVPLAR